MENEISKTVSLYRPSTLRENVKNHQQTSEARESAQTDPDPLAFLEWETVSRATVEQFLDEVPIPTREHLSIWIKRWLNCHYAIPDVELEGMLREFGREKLYAALVIAAEKTMASNTQGLFATVEPKFVAGILNRIGMPRPTFAADKPRKKFWDMDARERADEVERLIRFNRPQLGKLLKNPKVGSLYQATIGALRASRPHLFEESGTPFDNRASHIIQEAIQQEEQSKRESSAESRTSFQQAMGFSWSELSDVERGRMLREWATQ